MLFRAKEHLPDGNSVKNRLAYYWYKEGPYSETVYANIDHLASEGKIKTTTADRRVTYRLDPSRARIPLKPHDDDMDEASKKISRVAERFANLDDTVKDIYDNAPFKWYGAYNPEFKNKFENYCNSIRQDRASRYDNHVILNLLDDIVLAYPPLPKFMGHRRIFMDFAKMLNAFLRSDMHRTRKDMLDILQDLCDRIWDVFAYGVRVECHDDYYNDHVGGWKRMYEKKLDDLDVEIREHRKMFEDSCHGCQTT